MIQNRNLNVFRGGDEHPGLNRLHPEGLNDNELFRAVHDIYGHVANRNTFQPTGEEIAYASHGQMYSPLARLGMATETRGQNSLVNYGLLNAPLFRRMREIDEALAGYPVPTAPQKQALLAERAGLYNDFQYADQVPTLLPPEMLADNYFGNYQLPDYLAPLNVPEPGTAFDSPVMHYGPQMLRRTDPNKQLQNRLVFEPSERNYLGNATQPPPKATYFYLGDGVATALNLLSPAMARLAMRGL